MCCMCITITHFNYLGFYGSLAEPRWTINNTKFLSIKHPGHLDDGWICKLYNIQHYRMFNMTMSHYAACTSLNTLQSTLDDIKC